MKKKMLFTTLITVFIKVNVLAHGLLSVWANCNQNNGNNGNNYRAYAAAWCGLAYTNQHHSNCNANTGLANVQVAGWVSQQAQCGPNYAYLNGWTKKRRPCNRGEGTLAQFLNQNDLTAFEDGFESQEISATGIDRSISPNIIKIYNLQGRIINNFIDYASHISIHVWKPTSANDSIPNDQNSIYTSSIHYSNGKIHLTNFSSNDVIFNYDPNTATGNVEFNVNEILIDINNIDPTLNGDDYVVSIMSDAYIMSDDGAKKNIELTETKIAQNDIVFYLLPDLIKEEFKLIYKNNKSENVKVSNVFVFNAAGKIEKEISISSITNMDEITIDLSGVKKGFYYILLIDSDNNRYCKKIIKD